METKAKRIWTDYAIPGKKYRTGWDALKTSKRSKMRIQFLLSNRSGKSFEAIFSHCACYRALVVQKAGSLHSQKPFVYLLNFSRLYSSRPGKIFRSTVGCEIIC